MAVNRKYITCIAIRDAINNRICIYVYEEYVVCACKLVCGVSFGSQFFVLDLFLFTHLDITNSLSFQYDLA